MTFWILNPPEPNATPTQPGPFPEQIANLLDPLTLGRCGLCTACPGVWRLNVPSIPGEPLAATWSGYVYLHRSPYIYQGADTLPEQNNCAWGQINADPVSDANNYFLPGGTGWRLVFMHYGDETNWWLLTPSDGNQGSIYRFNGQWWEFRCLKNNSFRYHEDVAGFPFEYRPETVTITRFPY